MSIKNKYRIALPQNHLRRIDITYPAHVAFSEMQLIILFSTNTLDPASSEGMATYVKDGPKVGVQIRYSGTMVIPPASIRQNYFLFIF